MKTKKYIIETSGKTLNKKIKEYEKKMNEAEGAVIAYSIYWTMANMAKRGMKLTLANIVNCAMKKTMLFEGDTKEDARECIETFLDCMEMDKAIKVTF